MSDLKWRDWMSEVPVLRDFGWWKPFDEKVFRRAAPFALNCFKDGCWYFASGRKRFTFIVNFKVNNLKRRHNKIPHEQSFNQWGQMPISKLIKQWMFLRFFIRKRMPPWCLKAVADFPWVFDCERQLMTKSDSISCMMLVWTSTRRWWARRIVLDGEMFRFLLKEVARGGEVRLII